MGLDITAYTELKKVENPQLDSDGFPENWETEWRATAVECTEKEFPGRSKGVEANATYSYGARIDFRAGSYSGYNHWRDELARLAGYIDAKDCWSNHDSGTFFELISFTDCEGIIGSVVAVKLAKDFVDCRPKAEAIGGYFFDKYHDWQLAFELAASNGAVVFH